MGIYYRPRHLSDLTSWNLRGGNFEGQVGLKSNESQYVGEVMTPCSSGAWGALVTILLPNPKNAMSLESGCATIGMTKRNIDTPSYSRSRGNFPRCQVDAYRGNYMATPCGLFGQTPHAILTKGWKNRDARGVQNDKYSRGEKAPRVGPRNSVVDFPSNVHIGAATDKSVRVLLNRPDRIFSRPERFESRRSSAGMTASEKNHLEKQKVVGAIRSSDFRYNFRKMMLGRPLGRRCIVGESF